MDGRSPFGGCAPVWVEWSHRGQRRWPLLQRGRGCATSAPSHVAGSEAPVFRLSGAELDRVGLA